MSAPTLTLTFTAADGATEQLTVPYPVVGNPYPNPGIWTGGTVTNTVDELSQLYGCFEPAWKAAPVAAFPHCEPITTPYGPGFAFTCTDSDVAIWDSTCKDVLAQAWEAPGSPDVLGTVCQYTIPMYYPTQTFPSDGWSGTHWELHTTANQAHQIGINTAGGHGTPTAPVWRFSVQSTSSGSTNAQFYGPPIVFNTWHQVVLQAYWTETTKGFMRFYVDGVQYTA